MNYPSRIVCLTEETTETLYLLGEGDRVVGVSGYTVRPPEARQKPRVSAFINARFEKIEALNPDLILAFSDLQADIAAELARRGFKRRPLQPAQRGGDPSDDSHAGRTDWPRRSCGGAGGSARKGSGRDPRARIAVVQPPSRVFEEWDDPLISGIQWVEELIEIAGGDPYLSGASSCEAREGPHRPA
jgi:iron complex transport system substrate-binding protein